MIQGGRTVYSEKINGNAVREGLGSLSFKYIAIILLLHGAINVLQQYCGIREGFCPSLFYHNATGTTAYNLPISDKTKLCYYWLLIDHITKHREICLPKQNDNMSLIFGVGRLPKYHFYNQNTTYKRELLRLVTFATQLLHLNVCWMLNYNYICDVVSNSNTHIFIRSVQFVLILKTTNFQHKGIDGYKRSYLPYIALQHISGQCGVAVYFCAGAWSYLKIDRLVSLHTSFLLQNYLSGGFQGAK